MTDLALAPMPRRLDHIQGLRGLAILLVVGYHVDVGLRGGFVGVDVFFVISGYVITGLLVRESDRWGHLEFGRFYLRRIRRLLPALAVVLVATALLSLLLQSPFTGQRTTGRVGLYASGFVANLALYTVKGGYYAQPSDANALLHTWSLSVEEQFYLGFPLLLAGAFALAYRRPLLGAIGWVAGVSAASLGLFVVLSAGVVELPLLSNDAQAAFYAPVTRVWEFGVGALVALWHAQDSRLPQRAAGVAGALGGGLIVASAVLLDGADKWASAELVVPVLGAALLVAAGQLPGAVHTVLSVEPLRWIGDRSYSWYLWHWPLIVFAALYWPGNRVAAIAAALLALAVATGSYRYVEQRFRYPRRDASRHAHGGAQVRSVAVLAAVCVLVPATLLGGLRLAAERDWFNGDITTMREQVLTLPPGTVHGCAVNRAIRDDDITSCTAGADEPGEPIYLLGDSNAGMYADGLVAAGAALHRPVVLLWKARCAVVDVIVPLPGYDTDECQRYNGRVLKWLTDHRGGAVFVASVNDYIDIGTVSMIDPATGSTTDHTDAKARLWTDGLTRSLKAVAATGHSVVQLAVLPHPGGEDADARPRWDPSTCAFATMVRSVAKCGTSVSLSAEDERQARALKAERDAATAAGVTLLDLRSDVCPDGECATNDGSRWIYRDGDHISIDESRRLAPQLEAAIRALE